MNHLQNIRTFLNVVRFGSFAKAARQENIANSVVSKRIGQLEHQLGTTLLTRTTRSVRLTDIGNAYHEKCVQIVSQLDDAEREVQSESANPYGRLRVYCGSSYAIYGLAEDLAAFQKLYPNIVMEITHGFRAATPEHENYDICLQGIPLTSKNVVHRSLFSMESVLVASPRYLAEHGMPETPGDLTNHRCIFDSAFYEDNEWRLRDGNSELVIPLEPSTYVNSVPVMVSAIKNDMGIGIVPMFSVTSELEDGLLVRLFPNHISPTLEMIAYYTKTSYVSRIVSLFLDFLERRHSSDKA